MAVSSDSMTEATWQERMAARIGARVRQVRIDAGLGVQEVANHCTEALGFKMLRTTLANLEAGTRKSVSISELVVLAEALNISPLDLLYPITETEPVEYLPGDQVSPWEAWGRFTYPLTEYFGGGEIPAPGADPRTSEIIAALASLSTNETAWNFVSTLFRDPRTPPEIREVQGRQENTLATSVIGEYKRLVDQGIPLDGFDEHWLDFLRARSQDIAKDGDDA
jgi:transcriptional regulator with XRE-family HTH domain